MPSFSIGAEIDPGEVARWPFEGRYKRELVERKDRSRRSSKDGRNVSVEVGQTQQSERGIERGLAMIQFEDELMEAEMMV